MVSVAVSVPLSAGFQSFIELADMFGLCIDAFVLQLFPQTTAFIDFRIKSTWLNSLIRSLSPASVIGKIRKNFKKSLKIFFITH